MDRCWSTSCSPTAISPVASEGTPQFDPGADDRGAGVLQELAEGEPAGRSLLAAEPRALHGRRRGDDHLVAVHPGRAGGLRDSVPVTFADDPTSEELAGPDRHRHDAVRAPAIRTARPGPTSAISGSPPTPTLDAADGLRALFDGRGVQAATLVDRARRCKSSRCAAARRDDPGPLRRGMVGAARRGRRQAPLFRPSIPRR